MPFNRRKGESAYCITPASKRRKAIPIRREICGSALMPTIDRGNVAK
jgi:hypothetical protein